MSKVYETVIGLEVHVELASKTKIFCGCSTAFGGAPNSHTCPVCTGMPGSLPVLNKQVVEYAIAVGLATNCSITQYCKFDRKNYFYPDNPQNYQISQLYLPICRNGGVEIETAAGKKTVGIHEIHMEEDAGKLVHDEWEDCSIVDYNRSGVPLIEIVSEPDMRSAEEVIAYLEKLRLIIQYLGASDCKLNEGSMRADVNLSVREMGAPEFGTRTEMKNLNSFKAIARAIEGERARQIELIEEGKKVIQETRRWDDNKEYSYAMRSKEDAQDYRYFPEPDLVPIVISDEWIAEIKARQPELRTEKLERYKKEFGLPDYDAEIITGHKKFADLARRPLFARRDRSTGQGFPVHRRIDPPFARHSYRFGDDRRTSARRRENLCRPCAAGRDRRNAVGCRRVAADVSGERLLVGGGGSDLLLLPAARRSGRNLRPARPVRRRLHRTGALREKMRRMKIS